MGNKAFRLRKTIITAGLSLLLLSVLPGLELYLPIQNQQPKVIPLPELESALRLRAEHGKIYIQIKEILLSIPLTPVAI